MKHWGGAYFWLCYRFCCVFFSFVHFHFVPFISFRFVTCMQRARTVSALPLALGALDALSSHILSISPRYILCTHNKIWIGAEERRTVRAPCAAPHIAHSIHNLLFFLLLLRLLFVSIFRLTFLRLAFSRFHQIQFLWQEFQYLHGIACDMFCFAIFFFLNWVSECVCETVRCGHGGQSLAIRQMAISYAQNIRIQMCLVYDWIYRFYCASNAIVSIETEFISFLCKFRVPQNGYFKLMFFFYSNFSPVWHGFFCVIVLRSNAEY